MADKKPVVVVTSQLEPEGPWHAVHAEGFFANGGTTIMTWGQPSTDCGILVPAGAHFEEDHDVTCQDCIWGFLDPLVKEAVKEVVLEPIAV